MDKIREMRMEQILDRILQEKIIAIIRGISRERILDVARAIKEGGVSCLEIALDHSSTNTIRETYERIIALSEAFGEELCIGAGTVLTAEEVINCAKAGATYIISPNTNCSVIQKTKELGLISIPGALTPSEIVQAHEAGADIVKLFPAGTLGVEYIKAVRSPLKHIAMSAVGNITPENCGEFLAAGCCSIGVGSNLADRKAVERGDFKRITDTAREYVRSVSLTRI